MAWIKMISEDKASGLLARLYEKLRSADGVVDNILKIHSLNPRSLEGHYQFYKALMYGRSGLSRTQREMIAIVVSSINDCHY